jgi:hypothetical protein
MATETTVTDRGIKVRITADKGTIDGWEECREDLGLNSHGDPVDGVSVRNEIGEYHSPDDEYPYGYSFVSLWFDDVAAVKAAERRLSDKATERFEWGMDREARYVRDFSGKLPSEYELEQM